MELAYVRMVLDSCFYERIMNMKKLLATGLIASVAMSSAESSASCGNGGFYVGANFGVAFSKAKATNEKKTDYKNNDKFCGKDSGWVVAALEDAAKKITEAHANAFSGFEEKALSEGKANKKKTKFLAELVLGYDFRLNDVMLGVELNVGGIFGSNKLRSGKLDITNAEAQRYGGNNAAVTINAKDYAKVKEQWHIALMPRIGYLFTPQFEGYVTFGVKLAKFKTDVLNRLNDNIVVHANANVAVPEKTYSKKSTKAVFLAGAGVRYEFNPSMFAKLEYNFEFGAKPKLHAEAMPELQKVKVTSHTIKLGLGYRF